VWRTATQPARHVAVAITVPRLLRRAGNKLSWCWQTRATRLEVNQGHQTVAFHMLGLGIVSSCATVTLFLRRAVFTTDMTSKNVVTLKSGLEVIQGHWKRYHSIHGYRIANCGMAGIIILLVFYRKFVPNMHRFWDIRLRYYRDLEICVKGHSRSPFDRAHMTSYWRSIVTIALSGVVSEIFNVEKCCDLEIGVKGHWRSLRVVSFDRLSMISY